MTALMAVAPDVVSGRHRGSGSDNCALAALTMGAAIVGCCTDCGRGPLVPARMPRAERPVGAVAHWGRRLCAGCWTRHARHGTLADFSRLQRPADELLSDIELLAMEGYSRRQIAARLRIRFDSFERRYWRLRAAGQLSLMIQRGGAA